MGWSKSITEPSRSAIILLQWENGQETAAPYYQFWSLDFPTYGKTENLPVPALVPDRIEQTRLGPPRAGELGPQAHLPPILVYHEGSSSILAHHLTVDDNVNMEFLRWGPGIHLTQIQALEKVFNGAPKGLSGATYVAPPGAIGEDNEHRGYRSNNPQLLTAIATDDGHGGVTIKYRPKTSDKHSELPLDVKKTFEKYEQTLRTAMTPATSSATEPPPMTNIPVHIRVIGRIMRYLLFMTLTQDKDKTKNIFSLYSIPEHIAMLDAGALKEDNQDRGVRWQMQPFELPIEATNIAPVVMNVGREQYLFIFYFLNGHLHYAQMRYVGSGSFVEFVDKTACLPPQPEASNSTSQTLVPGKTSHSRFSLASRLSMLSAATDTTPIIEEGGSKEKVERQEEHLPIAAQGCQPYILVLNGSIWVFYEGIEGNGVYVRRKLPGEFEKIEKGWESTAWTTGTRSNSSGEGGGSKHFIPVEVASNYMEMF